MTTCGNESLVIVPVKPKGKTDDDFLNNPIRAWFAPNFNVFIDLISRMLENASPKFFRPLPNVPSIGSSAKTTLSQNVTRFRMSGVPSHEGLVGTLGFFVRDKQALVCVC